MAAAGGDDVNRDPSIKQQGFMRAAEIVEPQGREAELARAPAKLLVRLRASRGRAMSSPGDGKISGYPAA